MAQGCEAVYWDLWGLNRVGKAFYESLGAVEDGDLAIWRVAASCGRRRQRRVIG